MIYAKVHFWSILEATRLFCAYSNIEICPIGAHWFRRHFFSKDRLLNFLQKLFVNPSLIALFSDQSYPKATEAFSQKKKYFARNGKSLYVVYRLFFHVRDDACWTLTSSFAHLLPGLELFCLKHVPKGVGYSGWVLLKGLLMSFRLHKVCWRRCMVSLLKGKENVQCHLFVHICQPLSRLEVRKGQIPNTRERERESSSC